MTPIWMASTTMPVTAATLASWLVVASLLSAGIAVAALLAQRVAARAVPTRLVWAAALLATLIVTALLPLRQAPAPSAPTPAAAAAITLPAVTPLEPTLAARLLDAMRAAPVRAIERIATGTAAAVRAWPTAVHRATLAAWPTASTLMVVVLVVSYRRQRRLLQRAPRAELSGTPVHVSTDTGPAVIGSLDPAIVVPAWLLSRTADEQRLVIAHERAHILAHDPLLLLTGCVVVALLPWNLATWYMLARLRLAIELDCDARVLAGGTDTRRYGKLLIDLSAASPSPVIPIGAPAFSFHASHLERRLRTMTARPARYLAARRAAALVVGSGAVLAACGAELPTAADLQGMDVAKAETRIGKAVRLDSANTVYFVNGKQVASSAARGIGADSIVTINVRKTNPKTNEIRIVTKGAAEQATVANLSGKAAPVVVIERDSIVERRGVALAKSGGPVVTVNGVLLERPDSNRVALRSTATPATPKPLIFIDGKRVDEAEMKKLSPDAIQSIEVLKGAAAAAKYGPDGANGAIQIFLKK